MKPFLHIFMACIIGGMLLAETSNASICDKKESIVFKINAQDVLECNRINYDHKKRIKQGPDKS